jgi:hypothetical protein
VQTVRAGENRGGEVTFTEELGVIGTPAGNGVPFRECSGVICVGRADRNDIEVGYPRECTSVEIGCETAAYDGDFDPHLR